MSHCEFGLLFGVFFLQIDLEKGMVDCLYAKCKFGVLEKPISLCFCFEGNQVDLVFFFAFFW